MSKYSSISSIVPFSVQNSNMQMALIQLVVSSLHLFQEPNTKPSLLYSTSQTIKQSISSLTTFTITFIFIPFIHYLLSFIYSIYLLLELFIILVFSLHDKQKEKLPCPLNYHILHFLCSRIRENLHTDVINHTLLLPYQYNHLNTYMCHNWDTNIHLHVLVNDDTVGHTHTYNQTHIPSPCTRTHIHWVNPEKHALHRRINHCCP